MRYLKKCDHCLTGYLLTYEQLEKWINCHIDGCKVYWLCSESCALMHLRQEHPLQTR